LEFNFLRSTCYVSWDNLSTILNAVWYDLIIVMVFRFLLLLFIHPPLGIFPPHLPANPYYTIRSSAQLTVNSNAIIYTTHLHCTADRLTKKNLPTDCAAQLFECGRINKAAYFVASLGVEIYCWISAHLLQINNHKFGTQSLPKWSMHFATHSLAFTFALCLIFNLLLLLKLI